MTDRTNWNPVSTFLRVPNNSPDAGATPSALEIMQAYVTHTKTHPPPEQLPDTHQILPVASSQFAHTSNKRAASTEVQGGIPTPPNKRFKIAKILRGPDGLPPDIKPQTMKKRFDPQSVIRWHHKDENRSAAEKLKVILEEDEDTTGNHPIETFPPYEETLGSPLGRPDQATPLLPSDQWQQVSLSEGLVSTLLSQILAESDSHLNISQPSPPTHPHSVDDAAVDTVTTTTSSLPPTIKREPTANITYQSELLLRSRLQSSTPSGSQRLALPGLGEGRQRNQYGKSLSGGQDNGEGIIDLPDLLNGPMHLWGLPFAEPQLSCDLPMRNLTADDANLDDELPPLAIGHPARVWNSMLHSLDSDKQPIIQWTYEEIKGPGERTPSHIAHLTLILKPSHPSITEHPLYAILPKNRYTKEYITSVDALGGVRKWSGPVRTLKADAQNATLATAIREDAMNWFHRPSMAVVYDSEQSEDDRDPADQETKEGTERASPARNAEEISIVTGGEDETAAVSDNDEVQVPGPRATFMAELARIFGPSSAETDRVWSLICERNEATSLFEVNLKVGLGAHKQVYRTWSTDESPMTIEAVFRIALDLDVVRFLEELARDMKGGELATDQGISPQRGGGPAAVDQESREIDWQRQLAFFCEHNGLPPPRYGQEDIRRIAVTTTFKGKCTVDDERFVTVSQYVNIKEARNAIARQIFEGHFGQSPQQQI